MGMIEWAENEVKIACERERKANNTPEGEWDYGAACYESALKAYKSLAEDGHSGMSFSLTKNILIRLMNHQPLTPIEDTDDIWRECSWRADDHKVYQCERMTSLFKYVYDDGNVTYSDNGRVTCIDIDTGHSWSNSSLTDIVNGIFPITMPYIPPVKPYEVYFEDFLSDPKNGDYDTKGVLYVIDPEGERLEIDRFFGEIDGEFVEITKEEYERRRLLSEGWKETTND